MQKINTFLWFSDKAEEAAKFYTSVFPDSKITATTRYGDAGPGPKGSVMTVAFQIAGQEFVALNGGPHFQFTPAISLVINCESQEEVDRYWDKLSEGGDPRAQQCGWLADKYGLSWQVVPTILGKMMSDKDAAKASRVTTAMLAMKKLDSDALKRAYEGA